MEQKHEQEHQQWVVMEEEQEVEEAALEGRQARKHLRDNVISSVIVSSSSSSPSPTSNGGADINTNGVSYVETDHPDEAIIQKEKEVAEMGNVSENGVNAAVGLGLVAEFTGAATNGEAIGCNNVASSAASQNRNSVYFDKQEGSEANNGPYEIQNGGGATSVLPTDNGMGEFIIQVKNPDIQKSLSNEVNNQYMKTVEDKDPSSSELSLMRNSFETKATEFKHFNNETSIKAGSELIEEIDQRLNELDVETVLAKQETHDLFCPNCNSCITKRVILRKRKRSRSVSKLDTKSKPVELDTIVSSELDDRSLDEANQGGHANSTSDAGSLEQPPADGNPVQEPEVFRCLECFSFFILRGNDFIKSLNFGGAREHKTSQITSTIPASNVQNSSSITVSNVQNSSNITVSNMQNPSNLPASNENWLSSIFTSFVGKTSGEQGKTSHKHSKTGAAKQSHSSSIASNALASPENGNPDIDKGKTVPDIKPGHGGLNGNVRTNVGEARNDSADTKKTGIDANLPSKNFPGVATTITGEELANAGELTKDAILKPYEGEPDFLVASNVGSKILQKSQKDKDKTPEIDQNGYPSLIVLAQVPAQSYSSAVQYTQNSGVVTKNSSEKDLKLKTKEDIIPAVGSDNKGGDVILFVEEDKVEPITSQTVNTVRVERDILTEPAAQVHNGEQARAEISEPRGWEILKSIVYGGLIESITSLGIVSSAAGSGATPLNIIALGLANLMGGLFIIGDNLIELKNDKSRENLQQTNAKEDQYQELLGRRANFLLHAVVAVLSFLIFGSVPIVIYGILINKNYQPEVKLAAVAATSLLCIILLAIGKVYTKRPPKSYIKTVLYYVTMALAASGVSYIVGGLIKDLVEKFSHSESGFVITMPFSGTGTMDPAWRSH